MAHRKLRPFKCVSELKKALNESLTVDTRIWEAGLLLNDVVCCKVDQLVLGAAETTHLSRCKEIWQG